MSVRALILRGPGTNCDLETEWALRRAGADPRRLHVTRLGENPGLLDGFGLLVLPGGFSFGDDVAAGAVMAHRLVTRLGDALRRFVEAGRLVLGICNGFQILVRAGLLPAARGSSAGPAPDPGRQATLAWNSGARFQDRWVHLSADSDRCVFLRRGRRLLLPIAHGEGRFLPADPAVLERMRADDQIALRYCDPHGRPAAGGPHNPTGSTDDIAGVCDPTGRVFGLMPHPERHVEPTQHPRWTREGLRPEGDGLSIFRNAVAALG